MRCWDNAKRARFLAIVAACVFELGCGASKEPVAAPASAGSTRAADHVRCTEAKLANVDRALAAVAVEDRGKIVLEGVAEACELPPAVTRGQRRARADHADSVHGRWCVARASPRVRARHRTARSPRTKDPRGRVPRRRCVRERSAASFATCFSARSAPREFVLQLRIANGVAEDGDLVSQSVTGPNATAIEPHRTTPEFRQCILSRAGALHFERHASPTSVGIELRLSAP